jgi:hypothetical protein
MAVSVKWAEWHLEKWLALYPEYRQEMACRLRTWREITSTAIAAYGQSAEQLPIVQRFACARTNKSIIPSAMV